MSFSPTVIAIAVGIPLAALLVCAVVAVATVVVRALVSECGAGERRSISHASWIAAIMIIAAETVSALSGHHARIYEIILAASLVLVAVGTGGRRRVMRPTYRVAPPRTAVPPMPHPLSSPQQSADPLYTYETRYTTGGTR